MTTNELKLAIIGGDYLPSGSPRAIRIFNLVSGLAPHFGNIRVYLPTIPKDELNTSQNVTFYAFGRENKIIFSGIVGRIFLRVFNLIFDYPDIRIFFWLRNFRHILDSDVILTIGVPHSIHWGINYLLRSNNKQIYWIAESSDPFFTKGMDIFPKPFYFKFLEDSFLKRVDRVIVPFEGAINAYPKFAQSKFKVIPQGFDGKYISSFKKSNINNSVFTIGYAGALYKFGRNPSIFLKKLVKSKIEFRFYLIVNNLELIPKDCFSDQRFIISSFIPREELYSLLAGMDCILNFENNSNTQSPSKIIEYSFLGRPIYNVALQKYDHSFIEKLKLGLLEAVVLDISNFDNKQVIKKYLSLLEVDEY